MQQIGGLRTWRNSSTDYNVSPRSGKSNFVSISFPAWLLGHNPSAQILCASYGQDLSEKLGRDCRHLMDLPWYRELFPKTRLGDRRAANDFETTAYGRRYSTSLGGPCTGRGGDFLILDDIQKPDEALTEIGRRNAIDWYQNVLLSRLNSKRDGCIIIIMQRLHEDDLVGQVLALDNWEVVSLPAIAEQDTSHVVEDAFGRRCVRWKAGEPLHPERESLEILNTLRRSMGEMRFSAQYQQKPLPLEGAIIKKAWLKHYDEGSQPARFDMIVASWDTASKAGELNDFSVCTIWGVHRRMYYLLHVHRARVDFPTLRTRMLALADQWRVNLILIEDKASGTALIQELRTLRYNVKDYMPTYKADKEVRLLTQSIVFESGRVLLPSDAPWLANEGLHEELTVSREDAEMARSFALTYLRYAFELPGDVVARRAPIRSVNNCYADTLRAFFYDRCAESVAPGCISRVVPGANEAA